MTRPSSTGDLVTLAQRCCPPRERSLDIMQTSHHIRRLLRHLLVVAEGLFSLADLSYPRDMSHGALAREQCIRDRRCGLYDTAAEQQADIHLRRVLEGVYARGCGLSKSDDLPSRNGLPQIGQESAFFKDFLGTRSSSGASLALRLLLFQIFDDGAHETKSP